jgi:hypothetical protein
MANENHNDDFDELECWLSSCPPVAPPVGLRERCVATIPAQENLVPMVRPRNWQVQAAKVAAAISSAIAATILVVWVSGSQERSVFAKAIEETNRAAAVHILETWMDPERRPGQLRTSEWWIVPGVGQRRVAKVNGEVLFVSVTHGGQRSTWFPERNTLEITPDTEPLRGVPYFTDPLLFLGDFEQKAKEQNIPITYREFERKDKKIHQVQIKDVCLFELPDAKSTATVIVDVDSATNRIVRSWSHEWAVGSKAKDHIASLNATSVMDIDYPAPETLPESLFKLEYPADAQIERKGAPSPREDSR